MKYCGCLLAFLLLISFEAKATESDSNVVAINVSSSVQNNDGEQLNAAQLFEKQMLENRKKKSKNKIHKRYSGARKSNKSAKSSKKTGSGSRSSRGLPSLQQGMFIK